MLRSGGGVGGGVGGGGQGGGGGGSGWQRGGGGRPDAEHLDRDDEACRIGEPLCTEVDDLAVVADVHHLLHAGHQLRAVREENRDEEQRRGPFQVAPVVLRDEASDRHADEAREENRV